MAAKVVMVAVPTVLGIASIRVYTVSEAPADGLVTREKLNVYTPLPQLTQLEFVPDSPGSIERGLTAARESILPFAQAVKGACVSVKTGSVNLYHAGEDVYYYLKDPPPGFLPRFGTITMAGLLGMFLARKGSSVKRLAVPMGLMAAGASVCYPAQAVTVCKVTGKKLYTAGQWSSAAVSSLLTSKPQEPVTKEMGASQPQSATVSSPESAAASEPSSTSDSSAQSATIPEPEMESAESVPVSEEPVTAVVTEESSVTLTETSPDQATTEIHADPTAQSVSAETESALPEELPAPVQNEQPPETKQAPEATATVPESTSNAEPETVKAASVESAEVKSPPPFEEPHAPKAADEPAVIESAEPEPVDQPPAAAEEIPAPSLTSPPPPEHPAAGSSKGGSGFKPDPSLMDFGQSSPEDEDLYSTRS